MVQEWGDESPWKGCKGVIYIALPEPWGAREFLQGSCFHILNHQVGDNHKHCHHTVQSECFVQPFTDEGGYIVTETSELW